MTEKQVLFRIDEDTLVKLDRKLKQKGYKTRNAWFRDTVKTVTKGARGRKSS